MSTGAEAGMAVQAQTPTETKGTGAGSAPEGDASDQCAAYPAVRVRNRYTVKDVTLRPSRFNVLIGENGTGKTVFLRAMQDVPRADGKRVEYFSFCLPAIRAALPGILRAMERDTPALWRMLSLR